MIKTFALPVTFCLAASHALAACPTSADLKAGVAFTLSDGSREVFRRLDNSKIEAIWADGSGVAVRNVLAKGLYLIDVGDLVNGKVQSDGRSVTTFPVSAARLPDVTPGTKWTVEVVAKEDGATITSNEEYTFGKGKRFEIGGCAYTGVPVRLTYLDLPRGNFDEYMWLEELGMSLVLKESYGVGDVDSYRYNGVEAVK